MQVGRDVLCHNQGMPIQLGDGRLQHEVAYTLAVDEQVVIAQRVDVNKHRGNALLASGDGDGLAEHRCRGEGVALPVADVMAIHVVQYAHGKALNAAPG